MKLKSSSAFVCLLLLGVFSVGQVFSQELKIDRKHRTAPQTPSSSWPRAWMKIEGNLYRAEFRPVTGFLDRTPFVTDPFRDSSTPGKRDVQQILEEVGITFGKGAMAEYSPKTSLVTVVQTLTQMELVEAYLYSNIDPPEKQLSIRVEIYELPILQALELVESCEGQSNHTAERKAVRQLVNEGGAKLVALPSVISRSGQRCKIISAYEIPILEQTEKKTEKGEERSEQEPTIGTRPVGTIFEADPVLGADNWTLDIAINLEHHTSPPELFPVSKELEGPIFHSKEITTHITLLNGSYLLVGTWKPTGKPEHEKNDLMHVIFLTANVQNTRDDGVIQPVENDKTKGKK